jgi:hypothetical protein
MDDTLSRVWNELAARFAGPLSFRFVMQPVVAATMAVLAGRRDADAHAIPFLWRILTVARQRRETLLSGWRDVGRLFAFALVLDGIYQVVVLGAFRLLPALFVATLLGVIPYVLLRGLVNRAVTQFRQSAE